ncbi:MAG: transcription factor S, partial [Zestosphaera sp.]
MSYFCPKCGSLMTAKKESGKTVLVCPRCGYRREPSQQDKKLPT